MQVSKELLSAVLGVEVTNVIGIMYTNELRYETCDDEFNSFNFIRINDLFVKCKQWALTMGYIINSNINFYGGECFITDVDNSDIIKSFINEVESEQDAVIKACEWILNYASK